MLIAQLTDIHIRARGDLLAGVVDTTDCFSKAVEAVRALGQKPDVILVTGDIVDKGSVEEYTTFRKIIEQAGIPYFILPGNHDNRDNMRLAFSNHAYLPETGPLNWVIEQYELRIIGLDSIVPGKSHGMLSDETLAWLDTRLSESDRPVLIALHHPPFKTGMKLMDNIGCLNGSHMAEIVGKYSHVKMVTCGHQHRSIQAFWAGTLANMCPSVAPAIPLDLGVDTRLQIIMEPSAFQLHYQTVENHLMTHYKPVGNYGEPLDI